MLTMDKVHSIRQLYYEQGKNIPAIIAETGYDRKTICKYIDMTDFNTPEPKVVYTDQIEHTARRFSAWLPPIQCTLSGHQCMMIIQG